MNGRRSSAPQILHSPHGCIHAPSGAHSAPIFTPSPESRPSAALGPRAGDIDDPNSARGPAEEMCAPWHVPGRRTGWIYLGNSMTEH